jgi:hypothetical protein
MIALMMEAASISETSLNLKQTITQETDIVWSFIVREEYSLRACESGVHGRIFGLTRNEMTGTWRKLRNVE